MRFIFACADSLGADTASKIVVRHMKHLGLYVFSAMRCWNIPTLPQGELERIEQLEQLRWMEMDENPCGGSGARRRKRGRAGDVARVEKLLQK